ncbi:vWA domain-containing protein [Asanoa siamensis]|uniref:VWA domain-containing protein n=1 Tax=Asanoa siamensis TaxID=926357 RepID=A0ABQ4CNA9_9ACTN|nr:VWA domain-containing protein [Asanoa siamensis]GIF72783.1 VWA domain-containing protein [Asanoa siamensis]
MTGAGLDLTGLVVGFARTLRHAGVEAGPDRVQTMLRAVDALGGTTARHLYWAGRQTLCAEPDDIRIYDAAFAAYFGGQRPQRGTPLNPAATLPSVAAPYTSGPPGDSADDGDEPQVLGLSASTVEILRRRDFALLTPTERAEVRRLLALLGPKTATRRSRRRQPAARGEIDPNRTVRAALTRAGEPTRLARRRRVERPRRLVLLIDVSGSMSPYADALLRFAHAAVRTRPTRTEVFTLGTRLTRITRALRHRDADAALHAASTAIPDWHGGTRLADALQAFLDRWGQRGTARGAIVVMFSDGWERGDPTALAQRTHRLARLAYRLIWVNPHRGKDGFAPLAGGMAAALPHLDEFVAGHTVAALDELVRVIAK